MASYQTIRVLFDLRAVPVFKLIGTTTPQTGITDLNAMGSAQKRNENSEASTDSATISRSTPYLQHVSQMLRASDCMSTASLHFLRIYAENSTLRKTANTER